MIALTLIFIAIVLCLLSWLSMLRDYKKLKVRGPVPLPLIGNGLHFAVSSERFLPVMKELADKFGNVYSIYLSSFRYFMVLDSHFTEGLLSSSEFIEKGRSYNFLKPWLGSGLLTAKESVMGVDMNAQTDTESKYVKAVECISNITASRMRNSFLAVDAIFNLTSLKKRQDDALKVLHGQTKQVIDARLLEIERLNIKTISDFSEIGIKNKHAFLDLLLLAEINGKKIDNEHIREEVDTFMFEGHDTTASGITFTLFCLSKHKDIQDKIYNEQKSIFGDDMKRDPTYSELQQMKYLEMVIKEALRLYPSVPLIERKITQAADIAGFYVPANTSIVLNIFEMQRNPDIFKDPMDFRPERFDSSVNRNAFSWIPFSAGPRNCIGQKFAMMELKITIAGIIKQFHLLPAGVEPKLAADLILRSRNGVHVKMLPRE
ncbi:cytochrome P450 4c3-like isoform X2 [Plodia interpunctella]|uniref:cytochrome P450 4c3-like isoform X2 n=1 Tax=Plodia interpunctella TaxID=58824 RepID=UPI0023675C93|nr:cytochrome P450 4c3-like isoform X2 [Plodia interpunctella]